MLLYAAFVAEVLASKYVVVSLLTVKINNRMAIYGDALALMATFEEGKDVYS